MVVCKRWLIFTEAFDYLREIITVGSENILSIFVCATFMVRRDQFHLTSMNHLKSDRQSDVWTAITIVETSCTY